MRRLINKRGEDQRGATAVTFVLILVPLFVTLAFVGDAGLLYWEKTQLQNGADAAALAVAQDCAKRGTDMQWRRWHPRHRYCRRERQRRAFCGDHHLPDGERE